MDAIALETGIALCVSTGTRWSGVVMKLLSPLPIVLSSVPSSMEDLKKRVLCGPDDKGKESFIIHPSTHETPFGSLTYAVEFQNCNLRCRLLHHWSDSQVIMKGGGAFL